MKRAHVSSDRLANLGKRSGMRLQVKFARYRLNVPVPSELWGAAQLALKLSQSLGSGQNGARGGRLSSAAAGAAAAPPADGPPRAPAGSPLTISEALEHAPALSLMEEGLAALVAVVFCAALYCATAPPAVRVVYALGMAAAGAAALACARAWLLERQYKAMQMSERELAGPGALFANVDGTEIHYTREVPPAAAGGPAVAAHCVHGFGANTFSWSFVQRELAAALGGVVTAHDMPGFGLSARPRAARFYTLGFNAAVARVVMDGELQASSGQPATAKRILLGHSMGAAALAEAVIQRPEASPNNPPAPARLLRPAPVRNLALPPALPFLANPFHRPARALPSSRRASRRWYWWRPPSWRCGRARRRRRAATPSPRAWP
jgi:hypothetical protein